MVNPRPSPSPFSDDDGGQFRLHTQARDSSPLGNHLDLVTLPKPGLATLGSSAVGPSRLQAASLGFRRSFAIAKDMEGMPMRGFAVELWAAGRDLRKAGEKAVRETLVSYATVELIEGEQWEGGLKQGGW